MWKRWRIRILLFLAVLGPGFITANVDNDSGGILTYSQAGAQYGYTLLWTMIPITIALIVVQEMCARMGVVTGKGLSDLIREEFGLRITFVLMVMLVVVNYTNVVTEFIGIAGSTAPVPCFKVHLGAAVRGAGVVHGGARQLQEHGKNLHCRVAGVHCLHFCGRALAAQLARCAAGHGATAAALGVERQSVHVHGRRRGGHHDCAVDAVLSAIVDCGEGDSRQGLRGVAAGRGCGQPVHRHRGVVHYCGLRGHAVCAWDGRDSGASDAAEAMRPLAGDYAFVLFAFGLFNASLFAASILPLSTAYTVCEGMGFESGVDKNFKEAPFFYWLYTLLIAGGALTVLVLPDAQADQLRDSVAGAERRAAAGGDHPDAAADQPHRSDGRAQELARMEWDCVGNEHDCDRDDG